jgi:hypothetical protein
MYIIMSLAFKQSLPNNVKTKDVTMDIFGEFPIMYGNNTLNYRRSIVDLKFYQ